MNGHWEDVAVEWQRDQPDRLWREHSDAVNSALITRWLSEETRGRTLKTDLFDEAVAEGLFPVLASLSSDVIGIDVSSTILHGAGARHADVKVALADVRKLPFKADGFDTLISTSTLDHFKDQDSIRTSLREFVRVLKPGGALLITLDNPTNPLVGLRNALPWSWLRRMGLVPYFVGATMNRRELQRALQDAGLIVEKATAILHCPRVLSVPLTRWFDRPGPWGARLLRVLRWFEGLERVPTRHFTGHFVAVLAREPGAKGTA